tara:strand:- start:1072 stop:2235 length:1164 start_codon:yes stop_codon:yes gene_type:complete
MEENVLFANQVLAGLSNPDRGVFAYCTNKRAGKGDANKVAAMATRKARRELVDAQKFFIDNKLLEVVINLSYENPFKLVELAKRAIPPFNNMWIEWDEKFRLNDSGKEKTSNYLKGITDSDSFEKMGYHIQKINDKFFYTMYGSHKNFQNGKIVCVANGFYFSNENKLLSQAFKDVVDWDRNVNLRDKKLLELSRNKTMESLLGNGYMQLVRDFKAEKRNYNKAFGWFKDRLETGQSIGMEMFLTDNQFNSGFDHEVMSKQVGGDLKAMEGDLRLIISILGTLNYDYIIYNDAKPSSKITHMRYGVRTPKHTLKLVTIDLPNPTVKRVYKGITSGMGSPKSEHMRRGHWRRKPDGNRIWIEPMKVGSKNNGIIEHDYFLRGRKENVT